MSADWGNWAGSSRVKPKASPQIADKALRIRCDVTTHVPDGVILAQGGDQRGSVLSLKGGKPVFGVRQNGKRFTAQAPNAPQGSFSLEARLEKDGVLTLPVNGAIVARGKALGPFTTQPQDELSIGEGTLSPVGDYAAPHPLRAASAARCIRCAVHPPRGAHCRR